MAKVVVIGAGAMGLAAGYRAAVSGHNVVVVEASREPGGMAGHFDFGGLSLERYYHFVCRSDQPTFDLLAELGRPELMKWVPTSMGFYHAGALHEWGNPLALLKLPTIGLVDKLRYGWFALNCTRRDRWPELEDESARRWITRWMGPAAYDALWRPLFQYKFYNYADAVSASWIWTRIRRIGRSRQSLMQEELGYIEGGTLTLIELLMTAIAKHGGSVRLGAPVAAVECVDGAVRGVRLAPAEGSEADRAGELIEADHVISTVPTPYVSAMVPALPAAQNEAAERASAAGLA